LKALPVAVDQQRVALLATTTTLLTPQVNIDSLYNNNSNNTAHKHTITALGVSSAYPRHIHSTWFSAQHTLNESRQ